MGGASKKAPSSLTRGIRSLLIEYISFSLWRWDICAKAFPISSVAVNVAFLMSSIDTRSVSWDVISIKADSHAMESRTKVCNLASFLSDVLADCGAKDLMTWSTLGILVASTLGNLKALHVFLLRSLDILHMHTVFKNLWVPSETSTSSTPSSSSGKWGIEKSVDSARSLSPHDLSEVLSREGDLISPSRLQSVLSKDLS